MPRQEHEIAVMPFGDHLEELRRRLILALLGIAPILVASLVVGKRVLAFLLGPIEAALSRGGQPAALQVTGVFEMFGAYLKVSIVMTILIGAPWIIYQLWKFVAPGLYRHERRFAYLLAPLSSVLTIISGLFLYYVMLPMILAFFVFFNASLPVSPVAAAPLPEGVTLPALPILAADPESPAVGAVWYNSTLGQLRACVAAADGTPIVKGTAMIGHALVAQQYRVADCVGIILGFALALAVAFQMPVVVLLLGWAGLVTPGFLGKYRRHAALVCAVLGAVLTPADPISMLLLAGPLYILYEFGMVLLRVLPASRVAGEESSSGDVYARPDDQ
ncbi:MAG: preprotein translocase subunit TatC [Phycisphaeraceae bacterium]|nr:preprotein translocase subunit TatC [Phycisphaeraceae bacterium]